MSRAADIIRRADELRATRGTWENHWQEIAERVYPRHSNFTGDRSDGEKLTTKIFDSTPVHVNEMLAAGLHGMLTNQAIEWFKLRMEDANLNEMTEVKEWLADTERRMYAAINSPQAGFATHMHEDYMQFCAFGTSIMFVMEHPSRKGVVFNARPLEESYLSENAQGQIDTIYRKFKWTVRQVVQRWGLENVSDATRKKYGEKKFDEKIELIHAIEPRSEVRRKAGRGRSAMPIASTYVERSEKHELDDSGFEEMPMFGSRFYKAAMETYGRSPSMTALADIKMLNEMAKTTIKAAQKVVDPPLQVPDNGSFNSLRTVPGGLNYYRAGTKDRAEPLFTGGNIPISLEMMESLRDKIRDAFFINQLQLHQGPQMTATEVMQRTEDKLRLMGPVLGRIQSEKLGPMIDRVFAILLRQGAFLPAPEVLSGKDIRIEYVSPIARAQRQLEANGILRTMEVMVPFIQADPTILDNFDGDAAFSHVGVDLFGMDPRLIRDGREVKQLRQTREQQQQQQTQLDQQEQVSRAGRDDAQAEATRQ